MPLGVKINSPGIIKKNNIDNFLIKVRDAIDGTMPVIKKPKVLFICDVKKWAWHIKSIQLKKYLSNDFDIDIACVLAGDKVDPNKYDVYFTFGFGFIDIEALKSVPKHKKITGITAHRPREVLEPKMRMAGAVHANSILLYNELLQMHDNVYYLPNGVDESLFKINKPIPDVRENIIIGHVGKLSHLKGQLEIIEPAIKKARCLYHPNYKDHIEAQEHSVMPSFYNGIDAFIVASLEDGTPNPALEAAACGRPIISNRIGNMPEFIEDGVNGFLVDRNIDKYAEKIQWLRGHRQDLIRMGNAARKTVEQKWTWSIQAENYRKMIWDVINREQTEIKKKFSETVKKLQDLNKIQNSIVKQRQELQKDIKKLQEDVKVLEPVKESKLKEPVKVEEPKPVVEPVKKVVKPEPAKNNKPSILILSDVVGWAWDVKAKNLKKWLSDEFNIAIRYFQSSPTDRFNKNEKFDLYFTFDCGAIHFLDGVPKDKKLTGVTSHTYTNYKSPWKPMLEKAKYIHANSVLLQRELEKNYGGRVYYIPNGVDEERFAFKERDIDKPFTVGYVGKNTDRKGYVGYIVEACRQAEVTLKSQVCRFNSPNVIKPEKMPPFYHDIDIVMVASDMDGTPNAALEAASTGRTILSNNIGNMPEFIEDGVNGFLVERKLPQYVEKLRWMKEHRGAVQEMGIKARETIEKNWSWKIQAENYRKMFREALEGK